MKKTIMACILSMSILIVSVISIKAKDNASRLLACQNCNNGNLVTHIDSYSDWYITASNRKCVHYSYGNDVKWQSDANQVTKCTSCGYEDSKVVSRIQWRCQNGY